MTGHQRLASLAQPGGPGVAVPLGLRPAARIQEREWELFLATPTQLANGCRDLVDAVGPDAVVVTSVEVLLEQAREHGTVDATPHHLAAVEAAARLVESLGERAGVAVSLPGPVALATATDATPSAALEQILSAARAYLSAGVDLILIEEPAPDASLTLTTLVNIARFHQAHVVTVGPAWSQLRSAAVAGLDQDASAGGVVVTPGELPRDVDLGDLEDWVVAVAG
jgi:hypothetical protein